MPWRIQNAIEQQSVDPYLVILYRLGQDFLDIQYEQPSCWETRAPSCLEPEGRSSPGRPALIYYHLVWLTDTDKIVILPKISLLLVHFPHNKYKQIKYFVLLLLFTSKLCSLQCPSWLFLLHFQKQFTS